MRILFIRRGRDYSPNSAEKDAEILHKVSMQLGNHGHEVTLADENEASRIIRSYDCVVSMSRDAHTLQLLQDVHNNGTLVINNPQAVMLAVNARLAMYVLALVPVAVVLIAFFQKKLVKLNRRIREINSTITGNFNEGITGARSVKTLVIEDRIRKDFEKDTEEMREASVKATHYSALFTSLVTFMCATALALVLWKGGRITMEGVLQIGTLSVFFSYALNMMDPIQNIVQTISAFIAIQVNIERLTRLLHTESDVADRSEVTERYGDTFHPKKENWEPLYGDVEFRDVSFRYPDGEEYVLEHFNLKVPKGTNVAIVGETGAGKSTLVNLVCRFFEPT